LKYFEKIDKDLINNRALNSHEKLIYIICGTCHYVFDKPTMQEYILHNLNKRKKISLSRNKQQRDHNKARSYPNVINIKGVIK
jgi:uncharacterized protein YhbP (UPF0306 family)